MSEDRELIAVIDLIYEAVLDGSLWPHVLVKLADVTGAAQVSMTSRDKRTGSFTTLSPRTDPIWSAAYKDYWRFHNPLWQQTTSWPAGEIYTLDRLVHKKVYSASPVFNEWWQPSGRGLSAAGANLLKEDQFSVLIYMANAPGKDDLTERQIRIFQATLRHLVRAVRISRQLWNLGLKQAAPPEQFDTLPHGAFLVDSAARVVLANTAARRMLEDGEGLALQDSCLTVTGGSDDLQKLISVCAQNLWIAEKPASDLEILRTPPRSPLQVTVAPFQSKTPLTDIPWIGVGAPAAIVTVRDPDIDRRRQESDLRRRYGLTAAESGLVTEILKGDGRAAAARRRGISGATAKTHLSSIFEKTGTHRQAELIRLLLGDNANSRELET